jgi:hypothetical protein
MLQYSDRNTVAAVPDSAGPASKQGPGWKNLGIN